MRRDYFGEDVAARYDDDDAEMFGPAAVDPAAGFRNAAAHLAPGGHFVIELGIPDLRRLPPGQTVVPFTVRPDRLGFDEYDPVNQGLVSHHHWRGADGRWEHESIPFRYAWPAELDLMARIAGMTLRERWADWDRSAFSADSPKHVSVWRKDALPLPWGGRYIPGRRRLRPRTDARGASLELR